MKNKEYQLENLILKVTELKKKGSTVGFTNGCFDLLHAGHLHIIKETKLLCDFLIIGLNSDKSIKKIKGPERPKDQLNIRINKISKLDEVDAIVVFEEETPKKIINNLIPDVLVKGSEYKINEVFGEKVVSNGGKIVLVDLLPGISTSILIAQNEQEKN